MCQKKLLNWNSIIADIDSAKSKLNDTNNKGVRDDLDYLSLGGGRAAAFAGRRYVEILRRILGGDHTNLEHQILAIGSDASDSPPLEERPNADTVELGDPIPVDLTSNSLGIGGQVVIRRQRDAALIAKQYREGAGGVIEGVGVDVGGEKADGEAVVYQFVVGRGGFGRRWGSGEEREAEDEENWRCRH